MQVTPTCNITRENSKDYLRVGQEKFHIFVDHGGWTSIVFWIFSKFTWFGWEIPSTSLERNHKYLIHTRDKSKIDKTISQLSQQALTNQENNKEPEKQKETITRKWVEESYVYNPNLTNTMQTYCTVDVSRDINLYGKDFTPERKKLHQEIKEKTLSDAQAKKSEKPIAILLMGLPGAGKSTIIKQLKAKYDTRQFAIIGPDHAMERIPEYQKAINLGEEEEKIITGKDAWKITSTEAGCITADLRSQAIEERLDFIYDAVGNTFSVYNKMLAGEGNFLSLKQRDYQVKIVYVDVNTETAVDRATRRATINGRFIDSDVIRGCEQEAKRNFVRFSSNQHLVDKAIVLNNETQAYKAVTICNGQHKRQEEKKYLKEHQFNI